MPRYITSGANFTPFTYDELVKPIDNMTNAQMSSQEAIDALAMESGAIGSMIDKNSPIAKKMYDDYMQSLQDLSDNLYNNGYNIGTSRGLSGARKNYGEKIAKINAAITSKEEDVKNYLEKLKNDDTTISQIDPRTMGIDAWLDDRHAGSGKSYSGKELLTQAAGVGENIKREFIENIDKWDPILRGQYFQNDTFTGFHMKDINDALMNEMRGYQPTNETQALLQSVIRSVYDSSGMPEWADGDQKSRALSYIGQGIYSAIGDHKVSMLENKDHITAYQRETLDLEKQKMAQQALLAAMRAGGSGNRAAGSGTDKYTFMPVIASLRGEMITGPTHNDRKKFNNIGKIVDLLGEFNQMKIDNTTHDSNTGLPTDAATEIQKKLLSINGYSAMNIDLMNDNLEEKIKELQKEQDGMAKSRGMYSFSLNDEASSNIVKNLFSLNIDLSGKKRDRNSAAAAVAEFEDGKALSADQLGKILKSDTVAIGYDFNKQRPVIYDKGSSGVLDGKRVLLSPQVLKNAYGTVNQASYYYLTNQRIYNDNLTGPEVDYSKLASPMLGLSTTVPLVEICSVLAHAKEEMRKAIDVLDDDNSTPEELQRADTFRQHYNSLVNSLGMGLYNSSNTQYKPSQYGYSWSAQADDLMDYADFDMANYGDFLGYGEE